MPTPMAATVNQRIRRILSRQGNCSLSRYYPTLAPVNTAGASGERRIEAGRYAEPMHALGIDIGGSGIKAAPVDVTTGKFLADRQKIATPRPALPDAVADVVKQLTTGFQRGPGRSASPSPGWSPTA